MNLEKKCGELGIPSYAGRYNGPLDLKDVRGIIHIPYGWSNLALFENWTLGNVYLIPSKQFMLQLSKQHNFWWQDSYAIDMIESSEWYLPEHKHLFVYFDNWEHLRSLSEDESILQTKKQQILSFSAAHSDKTINQWNLALTEW